IIFVIGFVWLATSKEAFELPISGNNSTKVASLRLNCKLFLAYDRRTLSDACNEPTALCSSQHKT
ncbi:hypothetical protein DERP_015179, partial [Dermatophagoides pteronyssinus]